MRQPGTSVLLVTPDEGMRTTCTGWLRDEGLDVLEAGSATEALACHRRSAIPLTISEAKATMVVVAVNKHGMNLSRTIFMTSQRCV